MPFGKIQTQEWQNNKEQRKYRVSSLFLRAPDHTSVSEVRTNLRRRREEITCFIQMFVLEASLRLYSYLKKIKKQNKNKEWQEKEENRTVTLCVHFCFGAVCRLCSLPQNQTELLCTLRQAWTLWSKPSKPASVKVSVLPPGRPLPLILNF